MARMAMDRTTMDLRKREELKANQGALDLTVEDQQDSQRRLLHEKKQVDQLRQTGLEIDRGKKEQAAALARQVQEQQRATRVAYLEAPLTAAETVELDRLELAANAMGCNPQPDAMNRLRDLRAKAKIIFDMSGLREKPLT